MLFSLGRHVMSYYPGDVQWPMLGPESSRLAGTRRVADDLYLIAHHEISGRPYLSPRSAGIGMAGGLLAELMAAQAPAVTIDRGCVLPLYLRNGGRQYTRLGEPVAGHVLDLIVAESAPRPVRDWLLFLGKTSAADVAGRLERAGYLTRTASRIPWRASRPVPVEGDWSQCALLRAHAALDAARRLTPYSALLTGLTMACGLGFRFSAFSNAPARDIEETARILPRPLQELIAHVQGSADAAVLSTRT
jgi:Golgi phosphoprotein 3 (GPP34)